MTAAIEQMRRNVRVLDLMTKSFEAYSRGDSEASSKAMDEALEVDTQAFVVIQGGMVIGEVPNPERDWPGWTAYVAAQREALASAEEQATPSGDDAQ